jgi:hypothetical protein
LYLFGVLAILGALITITADAIVWYRMLLVVVFLFVFILKKKTNSIKLLFEINLRGISDCDALDYFFHAIHVSNVSITLSVFIGCFCFFVRAAFMVERCCGTKYFFGLIIIAGLGMIMKVEVNYLNRMLYAGFYYFRVCFT